MEAVPWRDPRAILYYAASVSLLNDDNNASYLQIFVRNEEFM